VRPAGAGEPGDATLRELVSQLPVGVAVMRGPELRFHAVNEAYRQIVGGRDLLGRPVREALSELASGEGAPDFFLVMERVFATGEPFRGTGLPARWDADGDGEPEDHFVDVLCAPWRAAGGAADRIDGITVVVLDVSERVRLQGSEGRARAAATASADRMVAVLDSLPDAAALYDEEWRYLYVNPAARALHTVLFEAAGVAPVPVTGRVVWDVFPWTLGTRFETESLRAVAEGRIVEYVEHVAPLDRWFETRIIPTPSGALSLNRDITAQREAVAERERLLEAERGARQRTERLQRVTAALSPALTAWQVAAVVAEHGTAALGASTGTVFRRGAAGTELEMLAGIGLPPSARTAFRVIPLDAAIPVAEVVRTGEARFLTGSRDLSDRYPVLRDTLEAIGSQAWAVIPLRLDDQVVGGLVFGFSEERDFSADDRALATALAQQCAQGFERARLFEAEREASAAAEQAADLARRLQELTAQLNRATSREQIADAIFVGALAAVGADAGSLAKVRVDADGRPAEIEVTRSAGFDAGTTERYRTFPVTRGRPLSEAVLRRETVLIGTAEEWRAAFPDAPEDLGEIGYEAFATIPVTAGERVIAALSFSFRAPRRFDQATRTFLATVGEQCGLALERQRLHEAELRHVEERAALLETMQDAFISLDHELRYIYLNSQAEELVNRSAAELLGRRIEDAFPEAAGSEIVRALRRVLATERSERLEAIDTVSGRWVEARIHPAPHGVSLAVRDVSERRRREDAAAFTAEVSRLLSDSLDPGTTLATVADAAVPRLADWCAVDLVEDPTSGAWPPQLTRVAVVHHDPRMLALGEELTRRYPTDWSTDEGRARVLRTGNPLFLPTVTDAMLVTGARDEHHLALLRALRFSSIIVVPLTARGLILGALTLCASESGRRYDEADLALAIDLGQRAGIALDNARLFRDAERARAESEAANRAKSQFLATMSHELRTPLNAIGGYAELLELGIHGPVTEMQSQALRRVQRSQRHLLGLINELLNYARLETGSVRYDIVRIGVSETLSGIEPLILPQVDAKGLSLALAPCDPGLAVRADAEKLSQVLLNLLSNAVKFTDRGGRVTVTCRAFGSGEEADGGAVEITVHDTGVGIPADKLDAIFEPFVQLGRALNNPGEGTGLGLAISRDLARGMNGDLSVRSEPGEGSAFTLTLPRG
jgi:PAS domain S-box-containing protein